MRPGDPGPSSLGFKGEPEEASAFTASAGECNSYEVRLAEQRVGTTHECFYQLPSQQRLWRTFCITGWGRGGSFSLDFVIEFCQLLKTYLAIP